MDNNAKLYAAIDRLLEGEVNDDGTRQNNGLHRGRIDIMFWKKAACDLRAIRHGDKTLEEQKMPTKISYHEMYIETEVLPRTAIFNLPFDIEVVCTRCGGWQVWRKAGTDSVQLAGEYHTNGLRLDVNGHVLCDSLTAEVPK